MAYLIRDWYHDAMDKGDPRVADWLGMSSPIPTILISLSYVVLVTRIGPSLMRNRKPFELKNVLIVYNALQVIASILLFTEAGLAGWFTFYSFRCQPVDFSDNPFAVRMAKASWYYYMLKFTELLDTVFFILRKKNNQVTTLHVVHHGIMPVLVWLGVKYTPGGGGTFFGFINTFVHIIMYAYYLLAALGPAVQPYLWWKRYLTQMQLLQFGVIFIHSIMTVASDCPVHKSFVYIIIGAAVMFIGLFTNFYIQSYINKKNKAKKIAEQTPHTFTNDSKKNIQFSNRSANESVRQRGMS